MSGPEGGANRPPGPIADQFTFSGNAGGTVKGDLVEVQGDHLAAAEAALKALGYRTRR